MNIYNKSLFEKVIISSSFLLILIGIIITLMEVKIPSLDDSTTPDFIYIDDIETCKEEAREIINAKLKNLDFQEELIEIFYVKIMGIEEKERELETLLEQNFQEMILKNEIDWNELQKKYEEKEIDLNKKEIELEKERNENFEKIEKMKELIENFLIEEKNLEEALEERIEIIEKMFELQRRRGEIIFEAENLKVEYFSLQIEKLAAEIIFWEEKKEEIKEAREAGGKILNEYINNGNDLAKINLTSIQIDRIYVYKKKLEEMLKNCERGIWPLDFILEKK